MDIDCIIIYQRKLSKGTPIYDGVGEWVDLAHGLVWNYMLDD